MATMMYFKSSQICLFNELERWFGVTLDPTRRLNLDETDYFCMSRVCEAVVKLQGMEELSNATPALIKLAKDTALHQYNEMKDLEEQQKGYLAKCNLAGMHYDTCGFYGTFDVDAQCYGYKQNAGARVSPFFDDTEPYYLFEALSTKREHWLADERVHSARLTRKMKRHDERFPDSGILLNVSENEELVAYYDKFTPHERKCLGLRMFSSTPAKNYGVRPSHTDPDEDEPNPFAPDAYKHAAAKYASCSFTEAFELTKIPKWSVNWSHCDRDWESMASILSRIDFIRERVCPHLRGDPIFKIRSDCRELKKKYECAALRMYTGPAGPPHAPPADKVPQIL